MGTFAGNKYYDHLPVWAKDNAYYNGAKPWNKEITPFCDDANQIFVDIEQRADGYYLKTNVYDVLAKEDAGIISTDTLGMAFEPEERYENPDGSPITFDSDYFGNHRAMTTIPGPFADKLSAGLRLCER